MLGLGVSGHDTMPSGCENLTFGLGVFDIDTPSRGCMNLTLGLEVFSIDTSSRECINLMLRHCKGTSEFCQAGLPRVNPRQS
jgi:hypothetical protein